MTGASLASPRLFSSATRGAADEFVDPRQPLIGHLCSALGATEEAGSEQARFLVSRLEEAGVDFRRIEQAIEENPGKITDIVTRLVQASMKLDGHAGGIGWLPLNALLKFDEAGVAVGFKGMPELDQHLTNWRRRVENWYPDARAKFEDEFVPTAEYPQAHLHPDCPKLDLSVKAFVTGLQRLDSTIARNPVTGVPMGFKGDAGATQAGYLDWITSKTGKRADQLVDADYLAYSPLTYVQKMMPGRRPAAALEACCGPGLRRLAYDGITRPPGRGSKSWQNLFPRPWSSLIDNWPSKVLGDLNNRTQLRTTLDQKLRQRFPEALYPELQPSDYAEAVDWIEGLLAHAIRRAELDDAAAAGRTPAAIFTDTPPPLDRILQTGVTEGALRNLTGSTLFEHGLNSDEFVERLVDAHGVFGARMTDKGLNWTDPSIASHASDLFLLSRKAFSRPGHPNGYVHEIEKTIDWLVERHDALTPAQRAGTAPIPKNELVLEYDLPSRHSRTMLQGPDQVIVTENTIRFRQLKSHEDITELSGYSGKCVMQAGSDLWRALRKSLDDINAERVRNDLEPWTSIDQLPDDWPELNVDGQMKRLEPEFESEIDGEWVGHKRDVEISEQGWFEQAVKRAEDEHAEINGFLADKTSPATVALAETEGSDLHKIMKNSKGMLGTSGKSIETALKECITNNGPFVMAEIMILRMLCDRGINEISPEMISVARKVAKFDTPLQINFKTREGAVWLYESSMTAPRVPNGTAPAGGVGLQEAQTVLSGGQ